MTDGEFNWRDRLSPHAVAEIETAANNLAWALTRNRKPQPPLTVLDLYGRPVVISRQAMSLKDMIDKLRDVKEQAEAFLTFVQSLPPEANGLIHDVAERRNVYLAPRVWEPMLWDMARFAEEAANLAESVGAPLSQKERGARSGLGRFDSSAIVPLAGAPNIVPLAPALTGPQHSSEASPESHPISQIRNDADRFGYSVLIAIHRREDWPRTSSIAELTNFLKAVWSEFGNSRAKSWKRLMTNIEDIRAQTRKEAVIDRMWERCRRRHPDLSHRSSEDPTKSGAHKGGG